MGMNGGITPETSASTRVGTATASTTVGANARTGLPPVPKGSPIVLDDDDIEGMDLKPAAKEVPVAEVAAALLPVQLADFTCAICLDAPPSLTDVASISGCTHKFCFDCIDQWANTENRCPCCKARFRTIDRVVALPPSPVEMPEAEATTTTAGGRRGKRKRSNNSGSSLSSPNSRRRVGGNNASASSPDHSNRRPNSRTVEDRNQPSGIVIDAAFVQNILASLMNATGGGGGVTVGRGGAGQVTVGTSEDGRTVIRMVNPQGGGTVGIMEMYLSEGAQAHINRASSAVGGGPARMAVRISRAPPANVPRRGSAPHRTMRPVTAELLQQLAGGRSPATSSESSAASATNAQPAPTTTGGDTNRVSWSDSTQQAPSRDSARGTSSSPRGRRVRFSVGGSNANGITDGSLASESRQVMTIRLISRPSDASQSTSQSPPTRSGNRRAASSASDGGSTENEPIVID